jgi:hypothetical protein
MDSTPYFMRGLHKATGTTAALASTSRYLNDARIRDWVATHMLRRSEKDLPTHTDPYQLHLLLIIGAINFVVHEALGGGIMASNRIDSVAKTMAQQLLAFPIPVSRMPADHGGPRRE